MREINETPAERGERAIREVVSNPSIESGSGSSVMIGSPARQLTPQERHARIAEIAYRNAEKRGLTAGSDWDDWLLAEREVDSEEPAPGIL